MNISIIRTTDMDMTQVQDWVRTASRWNDFALVSGGTVLVLTRSLIEARDAKTEMELRHRLGI